MITRAARVHLIRYVLVGLTCMITIIAIAHVMSLLVLNDNNGSLMTCDDTSLMVLHGNRGS